uniref:Uncharacterized protein n=1 Tax=Romanomermis culicivorax TaxID=13658 RepID=A0A915I8A2_ROMCU
MFRSDGLIQDEPKKATGADFHNVRTDEAFIMRIAALEWPPSFTPHEPPVSDDDEAGRGI